jgi:cell division transport system ATP-binding protein
MPEENIIDIDQLNVYQENILILSQVSFTIRKGEFVYLIGRTGSGKSSLLKTLYADLPVYDGTASVAGYNLRALKRKEIPFMRRKLGIIFQDFQLLSDRNISENLLFVLRATGWKNKVEMQARLNYVLEKVGLATKGFKMPNQLSGGEQQRVGIARALLNQPEVLLADEPTGNLDPETSEGILRLLKSISETGTSVLMATHDYSLFEKFPARTMKCEGGHLIA